MDVDPELFELLLSNLVDNAGKASEAGKTVRLRAERREEAWVFHVEDQGVGHVGGRAAPCAGTLLYGG